MLGKCSSLYFLLLLSDGIHYCVICFSIGVGGVIAVIRRVLILVGSWCFWRVLLVASSLCFFCRLVETILRI